MIVGLDCNARRVTAAIVGVGSPVFCSVIAPDSRYLTALEAARFIDEELRQPENALGRMLRAATVVWVERPAGRFAKVVQDQGRVIGVVLAHVPPLTPVEELVPAAWKKAVGLPGNAKKPEIIRWAGAYSRGLGWIGRADLNEHEADALGVAVACLRMSENGVAA